MRVVCVSVFNSLVDSRRRVKVCLHSIVAVALLSACVGVASGDVLNYAEYGEPPPVGLELLQEEPHDLVYLTEESGGGWAKLRLLDLPGRRVPTSPSGMLKFDVVGIENQSFVAKWSDIQRLDLWEERIEREARERINSGDFAGAFPFLAVLIRDYPARPGLTQLRSEYLWGDAFQRAKANDYGASLAMLEELHQFAPDYNRERVTQAIGYMTDKMMDRLVESGQLDLAQQLLSRLKKEYQGERLSSIAKWDKSFLSMAEEKREQAIAARDAKDYHTAKRLALDSLHLSPDIVGGEELVQEISQIYPLVNVGVLQSATELDPTRIDNWGARRAGRLIYRTLFEIQDAGPEGGIYDFIFGQTDLSPDRMEFDLLLQPERLADPLNRVHAYHIADVLADRARPDAENYFTPWAAAIDSIGLDGPKQIRCLLRRPNVLPGALLQVTVDGSWFGGEPGSPTGDYRRAEVTDDEVRYLLSGPPKAETQPREIVERRFASATDAVAALIKGDVDVLDQLFPADAARLRRSRSIEVANYPLPTVHMLVPCSDHPYVADSTFRRALLYGIDRQDILAGELLGNERAPGCQVLSGPFPAGIEPNDPLGYAYDQSVIPREYEPRLAKLLMAMNANQMKAAASRAGEELPELTPIRLAFPPDNLSRIACEAIRSQWQLLGLEVELVELPVGSSFPEPGTADIVYVAAAIWEPIIDARRVLGPDGLARSGNQLVGMGLRRLEESRNWKDARDRLLDLHAITNSELPVLPLWQMVDSYAYRRDLTGMGRDIISLYQNANSWRLKQ